MTHQVSSKQHEWGQWWFSTAQCCQCDDNDTFNEQGKFQTWRTKSLCLCHHNSSVSLKLMKCFSEFLSKHQAPWSGRRRQRSAPQRSAPGLPGRGWRPLWRPGCPVTSDLRPERLQGRGCDRGRESESAGDHLGLIRSPSWRQKETEEEL